MCIPPFRQRIDLMRVALLLSLAARVGDAVNEPQVPLLLPKHGQFMQHIPTAFKDTQRNKKRHKRYNGYKIIALDVQVVLDAWEIEVTKSNGRTKQQSSIMTSKLTIGMEYQMIASVNG